MTFNDASASVTTATFATPGEYILKFTASDGALHDSSTLKVKVVTPPPIYTKPYAINSPLWNARAKAIIVNWIPHCIDKMNRTNIPGAQGDGGIDNFVEAAKALRGEAHARHKGAVWANAWVHQTVESICIALMVARTATRRFWPPSEGCGRRSKIGFSGVSPSSGPTAAKLIEQSGVLANQVSTDSKSLQRLQTNTSPNLNRRTPDPKSSEAAKWA